MEATLINLKSGTLAKVAPERLRSATVPPWNDQLDRLDRANGSVRTVTLRPRPLEWLRKALVCGWSGYLLTTPWSSSFKLNCCLLGLVVLGTFRTTTVSNERITWRYRFCFLPVYTRDLVLNGQDQIVTGWEERSGLGEALLLGLWGTCVAPLADWLCPWSAGPYRLWVKNTANKRTLVWQGRVPRTFHRNHSLLSQATGLPSFRAPTGEGRVHWL